MADKKVENKELFGDDLFIKQQKDAKKLIEELNVLEETLVNVAKAQKEVLSNEDKKTKKSVENLNEVVDELNKAEQLTSQIRKDKLKLENKLAAARSEDIKSNTELRVLIQEQNKVNKEQAKNALGLVDAYQKQSKKLNNLRKQYKSIIVSEGKATKESKKLLKEIKNLDKELKEVDASAGQFQRNVGNYPEVMGDAAKGILGVAAAAVSAKLSFDGVKGSLEESAEGSENVREVTSALAGVFDQVSNVVAGAAIDMFHYSKNVVESVRSGKGLVDSLKDTEGQFERTKEATTDFTDKVKESIEGQVDLTDRIIAFEKAIRPLEKRIVSLNGLIEQQQIIAGDSTRSFNEISDAILKGQELQVERAGINIKIAKEELSIAKERIRIANLAGGAGVALLDAETEAINKLKDAENDLKNEILENEKEIRQVKQDRKEIDLDILIDGFDNQKTINERIIANEKETLAKRAALLAKTGQLAEDSFKGQKEIIEDLSKADVNVDDLLLLDATELAKQIQQLEQSEIINTRTLEVIRERRIVLQDLEDAQSDLNDSEQEGIELKKDIIAQEEALNKQSVGGAIEDAKALEDLEEQRLKNQIESLRKRLELTKKGSIEELRQRKELNDLLLQQGENINKKEEDARAKSLKNQQELTQLAVDVIGDIIEKGFERRIEALGESIEKTGDRVNQLRENAKEGQLDADQSIAAEQKREAELEKQRERERKRQQQTQAFFSVLSAFQANVSSGSATPLLDTIRDVGVLKALASGLSAYDGVDDTGGRGDIDSKGGKIWTLHPNEQVWSKKDRSEVGFRNRKEIKDIVGMYDNGMMKDLMNYDQSNEVINPYAFKINGIGNKAIETKLDQLNRSVQNIKIPETTVKADEMRNILTITKRTGNKIEKQHSKLH